MKCNICPRECNVDRSAGALGACTISNEIYIARAALHMWEEPCISGKEGSGTVFFVGCNLSCVYCQNYEISSKNHDVYKKVSTDELSDIFIMLQDKHANNINLVSPTHYSVEIKEAVILAKEKGLKIPVVYNCSGYEKAETLKMLDGLIDIYLTDFKYMNPELAFKYSKAPDYPDVAMTALDEMVRQQPHPLFDENGLMLKGVIVRNLLLPNNVRNSMDVCSFIYNKYGNNVYLSIMNQYTPTANVKEIEELNRKVTKREYNRLIDYVISLGVENAFIQEGDVAKESFIPDWNMFIDNK